MLLTRKERHREVKEFAQGHTSAEWQGQAMKLDSLAPKLFFVESSFFTENLTEKISVRLNKAELLWFR